MNKLIKLISSVLLVTFLMPILPINAASLDSLGLSVPEIQQISASENSLPQISQQSQIISSDSVMESPIDESQYRLGPGDQLSVNIIVGEADLTISNQYLVGADGKIFIPNVGAIYLSGLSLNEAKNKINANISQVYKEKYKLFVMLAQPKKVKIYLTGMVKNPGPLAVYDSSRISEVLSQAGGIASGGSNRYAIIKRTQSDSSVQIIRADIFEAFRSKDITKDARVQSGDIIEVPDADQELVSESITTEASDKLLFNGKETFVYVYGEVGKSGRFEYVPGKRLSDYISYAGGPSSKALLGSVTITRNINGQARKISANLADILYNGNSSKDVEILGGDVISVPGNFFYFSDFTSFANTIILAFTVYALVKR